MEFEERDQMLQELTAKVVRREEDARLSNFTFNKKWIIYHIFFKNDH